MQKHRRIGIQFACIWSTTPIWRTDDDPFCPFLVSFIACGEKSDDTSTTASGYECPTVEEDSCMTEELYQECLEVAESCESGNIIVAEVVLTPVLGME